MKEKYLNIVSYFITILFVIYALLYIVFAQVSINQTEQKFLELNNWMASVNKKAEEENLIYKKDDGEITEVDPLFTDGKTALLTSYNNMMAAESLYANAEGQLDMAPMGISMSVKMLNRVWKYNNNKRLELSARCAVNASGMFKDIIESSAIGGSKLLVENGQKFRMNTTDKNRVTMVDGLPSVDFSGMEYALIDYNSVPSVMDCLYEINEDTIEEISYFKIKYKNSVPYQYFVQAKIRSMGTVYSDYLASNIPGTLNSCSTTLTIIIDSNGNMSAISSTDTFSLTAYGITITATNNQYYSISCINEEVREVE